MSHNATPIARRRIQLPPPRPPQRLAKTKPGPGQRTWHWTNSNVGAGTTQTFIGPWIPAGAHLTEANFIINLLDSLFFQKVVLIQQGEDPTINSESAIGGWDSDNRGIAMQRLSITTAIGRTLTQPAQLAAVATSASATNRQIGGSVTIRDPLPTLSIQP